MANTPDPPPLDLSLLATFLAIYRTGSLSAAAPLVGLSQPAVTAQLRALERRLGHQLFERLPRGVRPTTVADELARQAAKHVDALAALGRRGLPGSDPLSGPVHLGGPAELLALWGVPALADLVRRGLRLRVTTGLADELLSGLVAGRFDLVVSTVRPRNRTLVSTALMDEEFVLVAAPDRARSVDLGRLRGADAPDATALRGQPLIAYAEDLPLIRRYWRTVFGARPSASAVLVVPDLRAVCAAAVADVGVTVLPRYLCTEELNTGRLVPLLEPELPPINTLHLAERAGSTGLPHIAVVRRALLAAAEAW
jgi:DNA-binding transcriptional LysR family regulator